MKSALIPLALCALLLAGSCASDRPGTSTALGSRHDLSQTPPDYGSISVTWELRFYVIGARDQRAGLTFLGAPNQIQRTQVDGFLMEIVEPKEHEGKILMAHFDGAGAVDPLSFYKMGRRYTEQVPLKAIGRIAPTLCR